MFSWLKKIIANIQEWRFCPYLKTTEQEFIVWERFDGGRKNVETPFKWDEIIQIQAETRPSFAYRSLFLDITLARLNENGENVMIQLHDAMGDWDLFFAKLLEKIPNINIAVYQEVMITDGGGPRLLWKK